MFVDRIRVDVRAGKGGDGSASFRRVAFNPKGGPDGGDGGKGGDVILEVSHNSDDLRRFYYDPKIFAAKGQDGRGQKKTGKGGKDLLVKVPPGLVVYRTNAETLADAARAEKAEEEWLEVEEVADLTTVGESFVLCKGGRGGKGNVNFKSSTNRAPEQSTPGGEGEKGIYIFELRMIGDVGLVGCPNAGKSTLLTRLSEARPKVAAYPFTTLKPFIGVVEYSGWRRLTVADIPGLIEGAHANVGLGHEFLRHVMRCRVLLFVLDTAAVDGRDPVEDLRQLRKEIGLYSEELARRPWLIAANKMDLEAAGEGLEALRLNFPRQEIIPISALQEEGIEVLRERLATLVFGVADVSGD